jgi:pimeloyl-ACP methyl ester carboxylesterase
LAADLPGHGADDPRKSRQTDVAACARLLLHLDQRFGPLAGLVGHSFGVVASSLACREGLRLRRFVGIGTPAFGDRMLDAFCRHMRMPAPVERALHRRMAKRLGEDFLSRMSAAENARFCHCTALILHDAQDRAVSAEAGEAVAEAWAGGAEFRKTTGLGHFRILRDADVIAEVARFIAAGDPAAAQAIDETATATLSAPSHGASG